MGDCPPTERAWSTSNESGTGSGGGNTFVGEYLAYRKSVYTRKSVSVKSVS